MEREVHEAPAAPARAQREVELPAGLRGFHFIAGDGRANDLTVAERLHAQGVSIRTDEEGQGVLLYRQTETRDVKLGVYDAPDALSALRSGAFSAAPAEDKPKRRRAV